MNYNTDQINALANGLTDLVCAGLAEAHKSGQAPTIGQVEQDMRELLRQIGQQALGQCLSQADSTPVSEQPCACGCTLHYQRRREAKVLSVFGWVTYRRSYYAGCACGRGYAPLDKQFGLEPGHVTSGLAALLGQAGVELPFEHSQKWLKAYLLFEVSENTIRQETERFGALQQVRETELQKRSQDEAYLQERLRTTTVRPGRLYGSVDAAKVRMLTEEKAENAEKWRDLKVGCWYTAECVSPTYGSARQRAKHARGERVYRAMGMRYYADMLEAEKFGKLFWATGCQALADLAQELVFVCDGAVWIWNLVTHYYPQAKQIVDWYHAVERLEQLAPLAFADPAQRQAWLERVSDALWEGRVEEVVQACTQVAQHSHLTEAHQAVTYFSNNLARMRYADFRQQGYLIGSGTVESGCKQIVTQRLKCAGAQWSETGAIQTAKARAAWLSDEWPALCQARQQISALPLAA